MLNRMTKVKLGAFVAITVIALCVTALNYVRLPQQVGIGRYGVDVELAAAGGLYPQATVTYRGVEVGKVTAVDLERGGKVVARLQIDNGVEIPRDSVAEVRSASVIGEQYVNFVPRSKRASGEILAEGSTVPVESTRIPTTTDTLLTSVHGLLSSLPLDDLRTTVREAGAATRGVGDELGRLISDSQSFQMAATANLPATIKLLEDAAPVLRTQRALDPDIRSFATSLSSFTGEVAAADAQLRGVLEAGAPFMRQVGSLADELRPVVPGMLTELADTGEVLNVYRDSIEHVLIVAPALVPAINSAFPVNQRGRRSVANMWFKVGLDPAPCTVGFRAGGKLRDPSDMRTLDPAPNDWCKVPPTDPRVARGARNALCPNGKRAATAALCGLVFDRSAVAGSRPATGARSDGKANAGATNAPADAGAAFLLGGLLSNPGSLADLLSGLVAP